MRTIRTALAAILAVMAFVAFESGADAQARRGESRSSNGTSHTTTRGTSVTGTKPGSSKSAGTVTRQSTAPVRSSSQVRQPVKVERKPSSSRPAVNPSNDRRPSTAVRPSGQVKPSNGSVTPVRPSVIGNPSSQTRHSGQVKPSGQTRPSGQVKPTGQVKPSAQVRPSGQVKPSRQVKPSGAAVRPSRDNGSYKNPDRDNAVSVNRPGTRPGRPSGNASAGRPAVRPDAGHKTHPHDRDFIGYDRPSHFWAGHNHCYGHRVRVLPSHVRRHVYHGITYYCYNDIWYRPYGGYYIVCRPPRGTVLAANIIANMAWTAVRLSYYYTVANTYNRISANNAYIAQQNAVIAQNNATIAAQNQTIAMNQQLASQAYGLANGLGLVQSYASAGSQYYYQDGVFYIMDTDGEYKVILPPAGALVETLPEDYEMVTLDGNEYYKVDDTIYRVVISEGRPYFEVLGQLYA